MGEAFCSIAERRGQHRCPRLPLLLAAFCVAISLQGCLPPDWSFCDCDFRDNFWNHVLNDIHLLWDGPDFVRKARDNTTFQGKYLQGPLPEGFDCPEQAVVFWKAWPKFGMTRGLIEGSMGDLWMPGARDRIKTICMAGHLALCVICSQHFLVKAARAIEAGQPDHMRWMEAAYAHMVAIRNLGHAHQLRNCMGQQGWSMKVRELHGYTEKWLGREAVGTSPMAAYYGGHIDPYQMLFDQPMAHTEKSRLDSLPDRRPCVPFKNPQCWKRMSKLLIDTCEHCCSPFIHKSGRGDPWCFDAEWTYERCCQTDFIDLVCDMKRSGEEGGCVDCQKSVSYKCLTPPEKRLQDAQDNYNGKVDKYNNLQADAQRLSKEIVDARNDLLAKDAVYQERYADFNTKLQVWNEAFSNRTRLLGESRLRQQTLTWNLSSEALQVAQADLREASSTLTSHRATLQEARSAEAQAQSEVARNESAHAAATHSLQEARVVLLAAHARGRAAAVSVRKADLGAAQAAAAEAASLELREDARRSRDQVRANSSASLDAFLRRTRAAEAAADAAAREDAEAEERVRAGQGVNESARVAVQWAAENLTLAEEHASAAAAALREAELVLKVAAERLSQRSAEFQSMKRNESQLQEALLLRRHRSAAAECLMAQTPGNLSAQPELTSSRPVEAESANSSCAKALVVEDENEFCTSWARAGECDQNPEYMLRSCAKSCGNPLPQACDGDALPGVEDDDDAAPPLDADTALLLLDLVASASTLRGEIEQLAEGDRDNSSYDLAEVARVPEEFAAQVTAAADALKLAREHEQSAQAALVAAENVLGTAEQAEEKALQLQESARLVHIQAASQATLDAETVSGWQSLLRNNESAVSLLRDALDGRQDEHRQLQAAANQALTLEEGLDKANALSHDVAAQKREAVERAKRRCSLLEEHISTLNTSISENLTTVVTSWLLANKNKAAAGASTWGSRLLNAAKSALVSIVSSIESFLETYVVSLADKATIVEMVRTIEDREAAELQVKETEAEALAADVQAQDAQSSLAKSRVSRSAAEQATSQAVERVADAEAALREADDVLQQTHSALAASQETLAESEKILRQRDAELDQATTVVTEAAASVNASKAGLRRSRGAVESARAEVVEATFALTVAEGSRRAAEASAVDAFYTQLRRQCEATEPEFEAYMGRRDAFSLLRAVVDLRAQALAAAEAWHLEGVANHTAANATHSSAVALTADARRALHDSEQEASAAAADLDALVEKRAGTASRLAAAEGVLRREQGQVAEVWQRIDEADAAATNATLAHTAALVAVKEALAGREVQVGEVLSALNATRERRDDVVAAEQTAARCMEALVAARTWFEGFVDSLSIGAKEHAVEVSVARERKLQALEAKALHREQQMKALLHTHERRLQLLNTQVALADKESSRVSAREAFKQAEQALVDAQTKLTTLTENERTTHETISKTYEELQTLLEEHGKAKEAYDKQDPEERKRSFSTKLSGTGPDPNGVDVR